MAKPCEAGSPLDYFHYWIFKMSRYTISFFGEKYAVAPTTFWFCAIPLTLIAVAMAFAYLYFGTCAVAYYTGMPEWLVVVLSLLLFSSVTLKQGQTAQVYALTRGWVKHGLLVAVLIVTICYVLQVRHWGAFGTILLFLWPVMASGRKIVHRLRW